MCVLRDGVFPYGFPLECGDQTDSFESLVPFFVVQTGRSQDRGEEVHGLGQAREARSRRD